MDDPNTIADTTESTASDVGLVGIDAADEPSGDEPAEATESTALVVTEPAAPEPVTLESLAERVARLEAFLTPGHVSDFADLDPID